ncbi:class I SAM-dependent methyltransferase [Asticcacaulis tiandongensis]|uniref:class I SAM-dependent methyltransferase n=1 Tax=Asticcacaulis tiandongensis TaxID=2565365 RepID=UPI0015E841F7|nr:class I SAM-dependent methyltransferase [Asticcacaulis tiandongensis]
MCAASTDIKHRYYQDRRLDRGAAHLSARQRLGMREVDTFLRLARLAGYVEALSPSEATPLLLDAGCGDKYIEAAVRAQGFDYLGLDIDEVDFERQSLPLETAQADIYVSLAVIEHLSDATLYLQEALRVLRPGGVIILSTPNFQMDFRNFYNDPTHVRPYTPQSLEKVLALTGFEQVSIFPGLRCKPDWYYTGKSRFWKARWLLPFRGDNPYAPSWLKGRATSLFAIARKPA